MLRSWLALATSGAFAHLAGGAEGSCLADGSGVCGASGGFGTSPDDGKSHGPLDCHGHGCAATGLHCHGECECRHLDQVEAARFRGPGWRWPESPHLVICAGPERTASTWLYNAVRLLHREARLACDSYWIHTLSEEKLLRRLQAGSHVVVKTHEWQPDYAEFLPRLARAVILTHRALGGVLASYRRMGWAQDIPDSYVADHMSWRGVATLDLAYEDIVRDGASQLRGLAAHLGLPLAGDALRRVQGELLALESPRSGVNQTTKLWRRHLSPGTSAALRGVASDCPMQAVSIGDTCASRVSSKTVEVKGRLRRCEAHASTPSGDRFRVAYTTGDVHSQVTVTRIDEALWWCDRLFVQCCFDAASLPVPGPDPTFPGVDLIGRFPAYAAAYGYGLH